MSPTAPHRFIVVVIAALILLLAPGVATAAKEPPASAAAHKRAERFVRNQCKPYDRSNQGHMAALAAVFGRTRPNPKDPAEAASANAELRTLADYCKRADVRLVWIIPSPQPDGSPDIAFEFKQPGLKTQCVEVVTHMASPPTAKGAARSISTKATGPQLKNPRWCPEGGGTIALRIEHDRGRDVPRTMAAAAGMAALDLARAPHVKGVDIYRGGARVRLVRNATGQMAILAEANAHPEYQELLQALIEAGDYPVIDEGGERGAPLGRASGQGAAAADPVDATREAIGAAGASSRAGERGAGGTDGAGATPGVMGADGMTSAAAGLNELGGIDFSSLELRYVSDVSTDKTRAAGFAFKALPGKGTADRGAGTRAAQRASEAFFVFLALDPRTFTVNLQPGQVDRIVDGKLGRTNAGRVMLEADLRMKKAIAPLIHPDGRVGRRYWSEIDRIVGTKPTCFTFRQWIVPAEATVYESEGELYILKAPLSVQLEADYYRSRGTPPLLNRCGGVDPALQRRIEAVYRRLILSRVQRAVRRAPEFAALRRVYFSRIAAEWYRERAAARAGGAYADIVGSGDIAPWAPARSWTPRDVFDRYMRSVTEGEFNVKRRVRIGNFVNTATYVYGGVLFSDVPRRNVSRAELTAMRPGLARRIAGALSQPAVDPQSGEIWLAGASFDRTAAASDPAFGSRDSADDGPDIGAPLVAFLVALGSALLVLVTRRVMRRPG